MNSTPLIIGLLVTAVVLSIGLNIVQLYDIGGPIGPTGTTTPTPTPGPTVEPPGEVNKEFTTFTSAEEFQEYLQEASALTAGYGFGGGFIATDVAMRTMEEAVPAPVAAMGGEGSADSAAKQSATRVSETNVQVAGIDEPDIVKTDGEHIYFSPERRYYSMPRPMDPMIMEEGMTSPGLRPEDYRGITRIIDAFPPAQLEEISNIEENGQLLLNENTLIVLRDNNVITGYDISDPTSPAQAWEITLDKNTRIATARLMDGTVYVVANSWRYNGPPCPIPLTTGSNSITVPCTDVYHPRTPAQTDTTFTVLKVNAESGNVSDRLSFVGSQSNSVVYMSPNALYLTYTHIPHPFSLIVDFLDEKGDGVFPSATLAKLKKIAGYDISNEAKMTEFSVIFSEWQRSLSDDERLRVENELENRGNDYFNAHKRDLEKTSVIKVSLDNLDAVANGQVPGHALNQFSLDEYDSHLRIATTIDSRRFFQFGSNVESENDVYVLDDGLDIAGSVKGLGLTERVYSARFIGDKGYVVTFRQTDPFYVLDLSDHNNPKMSGELKIPGFSSYLHPLTDDLILGVGREGSQVKLSLFDVSDPENPVESAKYLLKEYWSDVQNTHHAFLQDEKHGIFFIPAGQSGYIFGYDEGEITLDRAVSNTTARRALFLDDYLYIIGEQEIVVLNEADWQRVNTLSFR